MISLRLVVDTNIVISAALKPAGLRRTVLLLALTKPARLYVSAPNVRRVSDCSVSTRVFRSGKAFGNNFCNS
jgi:uncharacterized protein